MPELSNFSALFNRSQLQIFDPAFHNNPFPKARLPLFFSQDKPPKGEPLGSDEEGNSLFPTGAGLQLIPQSTEDIRLQLALDQIEF